MPACRCIRAAHLHQNLGEQRPHLHTGELGTQAEVPAVPECEVRVRMPTNV